MDNLNRTFEGRLSRMSIEAHSETAIPVLPVERLRQHVASTPEKIVYRFLERGVEVSSLTFKELWELALDVAKMIARHTEPGSRVILAFPPGLDFMLGFWGCLISGRVAVPVYPPSRPESLQRTLTIAQDAGSTTVLTTAEMRRRLELILEGGLGAGALRILALGDPIGIDAVSLPTAADPHQLALLQYTSGSTGDPKGVMVTHANLAANVDGIADRSKFTDETRILGWLPMFHDMGLVGNVVLAASVGCELVTMSPSDFLLRPIQFLQAMSRYRGTACGMPNFGFDLCIRKTSREQRAQLDLSQWAIALNGAETVRMSTLREFATAFEVSGFRPAALRPTYGLAEATLAVTMTADTGGHSITIDRSGPEGCRSSPAAGTRELTSSGSSLPGVVVKIVHPGTAIPVPDGGEGEICVQGAGVASGYWRRPEMTARVFNATIAGETGTFLRTGDLGVMRDGQLYVTGRMKDLIVVRGRNLYPQDVEQAIEHADSRVRPGCVAAVGVDGGVGEQLAVVAEVRGREDTTAVLAAIREAVIRESEVEPGVVLLVPAGTLPKTTSGKIRRHAVAQALLRDQWAASSLGRWDCGQADVLVSNPEQEWCMLLDRLEHRVQQIIDDPRAGNDEADVTIGALGLDSIHSVEFAHRLEMRFGNPLEPELLAANPTLEQIAERVRVLRGAPTSPRPAVTDPGAVVDGLSDDEVERLLAALDGPRP